MHYTRALIDFRRIAEKSFILRYQFRIYEQFYFKRVDLFWNLQNPVFQICRQTWKKILLKVFCFINISNDIENFRWKQNLKNLTNRKIASIFSKIHSIILGHETKIAVKMKFRFISVYHKNFLNESKWLHYLFFDIFMQKGTYSEEIAISRWV